LAFLRNVLRVYSYIYGAVLCGMGLLLCAFFAASKNVQPNLRWLPWTPETQIYWIVGLSLLGLASILLAALGKFRVLFFVFSGYVLYILIRGLFISPQHTFSGPSEARNAALVVLGALVSFVGALPIATPKRR
jgi:hypothetical protein